MGNCEVIKLLEEEIVDAIQHQFAQLHALTTAESAHIKAQNNFDDASERVTELLGKIAKAKAITDSHSSIIHVQGAE